MSGLRSNKEWKQWGEEDPLFGVLNWSGKQKGSPSAWTENEFYAIGKSDWADFLAQWEHYGVRKDNCLEIGCGTGRITKQLSLTFKHIYAVDVSEAMITYARKMVDANNVEFSMVDGMLLPQQDGSIQAVFSCCVLQHLDSVEVGIRYFREFYRTLQSGGTMMVQVPLYQWPTSDSQMFTKLLEVTYGARLKISSVLAELRRRSGKRTMRSTPYPIKRLHRSLKDIGFKRIELRMFPVHSDGSLRPFVFATK
jgi:ubiquinone/menaquinone biosynthesis C-methylase UbiE